MVHANRLHQGRGLLLLALAASLLAAPPARAQSPTATITGTVTDAQGAAVPGVAVVARHLATNRTFSGLSSQDGVYVITSLPVGRFEVTAGLSGFKSFKRTDVALAVGERLRVDVPLQRTCPSTAGTSSTSSRSCPACSRASRTPTASRRWTTSASRA